MLSLFKKIIGGGPNFAPIIQEINSIEPEMEKLSSDELKLKSAAFKERVKNGESLDSILPEAFALVREAAKRTLGQRHFDVQLFGGVALHKGAIAEMMTGEGKTLSATTAVYLNALTGRGVHVVTVNEYLAKRDMVWMGQIFGALGLTTGCITGGQSYVYDVSYVNSEKDQVRDKVGGFKVVESFLRPATKKEAYDADITYGTNSQFGFDYLRDNLARSVEDVVQRGHVEGGPPIVGARLDVGSPREEERSHVARTRVVEQGEASGEAAFHQVRLGLEECAQAHGVPALGHGLGPGGLAQEGPEGAAEDDEDERHLGDVGQVHGETIPRPPGPVKRAIPAPKL